MDDYNFFARDNEAKQKAYDDGKALRREYGRRWFEGVYINPYEDVLPDRLGWHFANGFNMADADFEERRQQR